MKQRVNFASRLPASKRGSGTKKVEAGQPVADRLLGTGSRSWGEAKAGTIFGELGLA
jgi:hypothetical protein